MTHGLPRRAPRGQYGNPLTVGQLRHYLEDVPDDVPLYGETPLSIGPFGGLKFVVDKALYIGARTNDKGLILTCLLDHTR